MNQAGACYQEAIANRPPDAGNWPNISAQSHVYKRGDLETLTIESAQDYDRLQERQRITKDTKPTPSAMTMQYHRSKTGSSRRLKCRSPYIADHPMLPQSVATPAHKPPQFFGALTL